MKLLGWMHCKFWQNTGDPLRDLSTGSTTKCLAIQQSPDDHRHFFLPTAPEKQLDSVFEEPPAFDTLLFEGLLAIGTFGSPVITAAATMDEIAEKDTESDVMRVTDELHKEKGKGDHRLQEFLIGSTVVGERRCEARASLGELIMKSRVAEAAGGGGTIEEEECVQGGIDDGMASAGMHDMTKRKLKRSRSNGGGGGGKCNAAVTSKLPKILRIFHKKIHPETATASKKFVKSSKHEEKQKSYMTENCSHKSNDKGNQMTITNKSFKGEGISSFRCHSYPESSRVIGRNSTNGNGEHWIKTDADYLVLEL